MKHRGIGCVAVAAVLACAAGCGTKGKTEGAQERFTVTEVDLRDAISQTGEVRPIVKVEIKSEASGKIEKIFVKEGQALTKGEKILTIDPLRLRTRKKALDLAVAEAKIRMELAKRDLDNATALAATGTVSEKQMGDLKSEYDLKRIGYRKQMLELDDVNDQLRQTVVVSPMDGVLTNLDVEEGEIAVSATSGFQSGTSIGTVADISRLEVVTQVGEVDYIHLKKGQKVVIRPEAREGTQTQGTIDFISLTAKKSGDSELGTFEVRVSGIAPGVNVNVEFVVLEKKGVLGVPYHFVKKDGPRSTVLIAEANGKRGETLRPQAVETGSTDYNHMEILSGVKKGDVVVFVPEEKKDEEEGGGRRGPR
jgi:HlyD family secretion protein